MCIPRGVSSTKDNGYIETKQTKHIKKVSKEQFEHGDPSFVDERKVTSKEQSRSFLRELFK
ncbi:MAG: hypothetical protein U9P71_02465 [Campylobacterota bacterium]|nr:hypothetical protein [Campylobacterota bacterium]